MVVYYAQNCKQLERVELPGAAQVAIQGAFRRLAVLHGVSEHLGELRGCEAAMVDHGAEFF